MNNKETYIEKCQYCDGEFIIYKRYLDRLKKPSMVSQYYEIKIYCPYCGSCRTELHYRDIISDKKFNIEGGSFK